MKHLIGSLPSLVVLSLGATLTAQAAFIQRTAAFQGQYSESFESIPDGNLKGLMSGMASATGVGDTTVVIQNGMYPNLWGQTAPDGGYFLGASAGAAAPATVELQFEAPVNRFGALFGHRVRPGVETAGETEVVFYDSQNREIGRDRIAAGSEPGAVAAYWTFKRDVKRITFSNIHPLCDSMTASVNTIQSKKLSRKAGRR